MAKILTIEVQQEEAGKILSKMTEQFASINSILRDASGVMSKINKKDKDYQRLNEALGIINTTTKSAIKIFEADKRQIQSKLAVANKFYDTIYLPLAEKINNPAQGLSATLKATQKDYNDYKIAREKCDAKFNEIINIAKKCSVTSRELASIEKTIRKFHVSAETGTTKISTLLADAKDTSEKINHIHKNITQLHEESQSSAREIEKFEEDSKILNAKIIEFHRVSDENKKAIEKIYDIAHETGLSGAFETRQSDLQKEMRKWKWWVFGASMVLLGGIIVFYVAQLNLHGWNVEKAFDLNFYIRFLIFSPLVYYLYFVSTQYNKAQKLHDKYAFKATLAMVVRSHIELLTQRGYFEQEGQCDKILDFIISGFGKIYSEPYTDDNYKMKIKLANIEIDMHKKVIDKLKEEVGAESLLNITQSVIDSK